LYQIWYRAFYITQIVSHTCIMGIEDTIQTNAEGPASASGDGQSMSQHSLRDQIEVDKYLEAKAATRRTGFPLRLFKLKPGGTT